MIEVNYCTKRPEEHFRAYIGAGGKFAVQLRLKNSGILEYRAGEDEDWSEVQ